MNGWTEVKKKKRVKKVKITIPRDVERNFSLIEHYLAKILVKADDLLSTRSLTKGVNTMLTGDIRFTDENRPQEFTSDEVWDALSKSSLSIYVDKYIPKPDKSDLALWALKKVDSGSK